MSTLEFVLPEGSPDPCPNACGGLTEDPYGGPCKACWAATSWPRSDEPDDDACPTCDSMTRDGDLKAGRNAVDHGDGPEWCDDEWHDQGGER